MKKVLIYTTEICPYCERAKNLLKRKNVSYEEKRIDLDPSLREEMILRSQRKTVPQIFIDDFHVGGCDDLYDLENKAALDSLLKDER